MEVTATPKRDIKIEVASQPPSIVIGSRRVVEVGISKADMQLRAQRNLGMEMQFVNKVIETGSIVRFTETQWNEFRQNHTPDERRWYFVTNNLGVLLYVYAGSMLFSSLVPTPPVDTTVATFQSNHVPSVPVGVHDAYTTLLLQGKTLDEAFDYLFVAEVPITFIAPTFSLSRTSPSSSIATIEPSASTDFSASISTITGLKYNNGRGTYNMGGSWTALSASVGGTSVSVSGVVAGASGVINAGPSFFASTGMKTLSLTLLFTTDTSGDISDNLGISHAVADYVGDGILSSYTVTKSVSVLVDLKAFWGWSNTGTLSSWSDVTALYGDSAFLTSNPNENLTELSSLQNGTVQSYFYICIPTGWYSKASTLTIMNMEGNPTYYQSQLTYEGTLNRSLANTTFEYKVYRWTAASTAGFTMKLVI